MTQDTGLERGPRPHGCLLLRPHGSLASGAVAAVPQGRMRAVQVLVGPVHVSWGDLGALRRLHGGPIVPWREEALLELGWRVDGVGRGAAHAAQLQGARPGAQPGHVGRCRARLLLRSAQPVPAVLAQSHGRLHGKVLVLLERLSGMGLRHSRRAVQFCGIGSTQRTKRSWHRWSHLSRMWHRAGHAAVLQGAGEASPIGRAHFSSSRH